MKQDKSIEHFLYYDVFSKDEEELFERVEKALGFKLFVWQKTYIHHGKFRRFGKTTAECLRILLTNGAPLDYTNRRCSRIEQFERSCMLELKEKLTKAGIWTRPIWLTEKDKQMIPQKPDGMRAVFSTIDETHTYPVEEAKKFIY